MFFLKSRLFVVFFTYVFKIISVNPPVAGGVHIRCRQNKLKIIMNEDRLYELIREKEQIASVAFPALMRKVYVWMTLALAITGFTAYGVATSPGIMSAIVANRMIMWVLLIAEFALVWYVSARIDRLSLATATVLFVVYSVLNGATLSVIFLAYTLQSIASVFFITAGTFAAMSLVGYFTKADLSSLGKILFMALIGLIIATLVNVFLIKSGGFSLIISYVGVLIFVGLTAYDTQKIKQMLVQADDVNEDAQKIALLGSLSLYLDFINLFLYLLRIFGGNRE